MAMVRNTDSGPRGAYLKGALVWANPGEVIEADDFAEDWFSPADPLDHDGDGKPGGSPAGENATRTRGRARK